MAGSTGSNPNHGSLWTVFEKGDCLQNRSAILVLAIAGTPLEPVVAAFRQELEGAGIRRLRPHFYLSTEWGVNSRTIAIGIPFYLARPELTAIHAESIGYVEGGGPPGVAPLFPPRDGARRQLRLQAL